MDPITAYLNGAFVPSASLTITDAGFAWGATVVDNARTFGGRLFRWADHLARFRRDCADCFVPLAATDDELTAAAEVLVRRNAADGDIHVATFATPGPPGGPPTLGMTTYPIRVARYRSYFAEGVSLAVVGHQPADAAAVLPPRVKHRSRMAWWIADHLPRPPGTVAILTDRPGGTLTETSTANFLAVENGIVKIPPRGLVLDGISLRVTREMCDRFGVRVEECELPADAAQHWDEAMLTGTGFGVAGVRRVGEVVLPWPGPLTRRLLAAWNAATGVDVAGQFLASETSHGESRNTC